MSKPFVSRTLLWKREQNTDGLALTAETEFGTVLLQFSDTAILATVPWEAFPVTFDEPSPASISSVRRAIAFVENLYSRQMFTSENRKLMFLYHYNENKWNHATAETPFGQIVYRAVKSDNGKTMRVTDLQSPFGNYSEQSIDPRELQIGQMLSGADNIAEIDRRISALFFRVVDSLDAITSAELSFNNQDAAKPDIDTPCM